MWISLVGAVEKWTTANNCQEIASDTEIDNLLSQQVHQQLGFEETARIVIFRKPLTKP